MTKRNALIARLGQLEQQRQAVQLMDQAMQVLTPQERLVTDMTLIRPHTNNIRALCGILGVEKSTIYRYRDTALRKLLSALPAGIDN